MAVRIRAFRGTGGPETDGLVERLILHSGAQEATYPSVYAEARRLDEKLLALRERLVYGYFGEAEIRFGPGLRYDPARDQSAPYGKGGDRRW